MIDFHSHILPGVDDGSASVEESLELLRMLASQGVDTVVATPHFIPTERRSGIFLTDGTRRTKSFANAIFPDFRR